MKKNIINFWVVSSLSSVALMSNGAIPVFAESDSENHVSASQNDHAFQTIKSLSVPDKAAVKKVVAMLDKAGSYNIAARMHDGVVEFNIDEKVPCVGGCGAGACSACAPASPVDIDKTNIKQIYVGENIGHHQFEEALVLAGYGKKVIWNGKTAELADGCNLHMLEKVYSSVANLGDIAVVAWKVPSGMSSKSLDALRQAGVDINDSAQRAVVRAALA